MTNNKNMNKKFTFAISSKTFITVILLIGLVTSPLTANLSSIDLAYAEEQQQKQEQIQQKQEQIQQKQEQIQQHQQHQIKKDDKKEVFHTLTSISLSSPPSSSLTSLASSNGVKHDIEIVVITLPTGQSAYKMVSHVKSNNISSPSNVDTSTASVNNNDNIDLTSKYSKLATIPGPTLVVSEGDYVNVNIKDKDGNLVTSEDFIASQ